MSKKWIPKKLEHKMLGLIDTCIRQNKTKKFKSSPNTTTIKKIEKLTQIKQIRLKQNNNKCKLQQKKWNMTK